MNRKVDASTREQQTTRRHESRDSNDSLANVLEQAMHNHQEGRVGEAISVYQQVLEANPDQPEALHFMGLAHQSMGDIETAMDYIVRALQVAPDYVEALNNLAVIFQVSGKLEEAESCFRKALELRPEHSDSHNNLGVALKNQGRMSEAGACFLKAIEYDPNHARAHHNLGNLYHKAGCPEEAINHLRIALASGLEVTKAKQTLVKYLHEAGRDGEALQVLDEWLELDPGNPLALHKKAALEFDPTPVRASDEYVKTVFDDMADSFESHLGNLKYRAPELVVATLKSELTLEAGALSILDAGCGTGLCGPLVKSFTNQLVGVDLSRKMLEKARATGVYDELIEEELTAFLQRSPGVYDIIICADTLCYFGDLSEVSEAAASALSPGGHFVFTVEYRNSEDKSGYLLHPNGRYSHRQDYILDVLNPCGFELISVQVEVLRIESGRSVEGLIMHVKTPPAA